MSPRIIVSCMLIIRRYDEFILLLTGVDGTARLFVNGIMNYTSVVCHCCGITRGVTNTNTTYNYIIVIDI